MAPQDPLQEQLPFAYPPHLAEFALPRPAFNATRPDFTDFVVGGLIFSRGPSPSSDPRVLLLKRAESDSYPGYWEGPGGLCDPPSESILAGTAREVTEESGFHVCRVVDLVSVDEWVRLKPDRVRRVAKFTFLVEVEEARSRSSGEGEGARWEDGVVLDPEEHQAFVWMTEVEVRAAIETGGEGEYKFLDIQGRNLLTAFEMVKALGS